MSAPGTSHRFVAARQFGELDWEDVHYFVALARYGTLSATARRLRVNHATVARRVTSLETQLGHLAVRPPR
jgi:Bacterial regulatory helix-turn-helix protein, lysR family